MPKGKAKGIQFCFSGKRSFRRFLEVAGAAIAAAAAASGAAAAIAAAEDSATVAAVVVIAAAVNAGPGADGPGAAVLVLLELALTLLI